MEKAGIPEDQAKVVVELIGERVNVSVSSAMSEVVEKYHLDEVATKSDLENMVTKYRLNEIATKTDLKNMELRFHAEIALLKAMLYCQSVILTFLVFGTVVLAIKGL